MIKKVETIKTNTQPKTELEKAILRVFNGVATKLNEIIDAVNAIQKEREAEWFEIKEWIGILGAVRESVNIHEKQIDELQMKVEPAENTIMAKNANVAGNFTAGGRIRIDDLDDPFPENVQGDHYWFKQQERYKAALVLIRNLSGAGMSYHDMCIESREIAKWALDPDYKPLLIGRYSKDDQELFDTLRETKGADNE